MARRKLNRYYVACRPGGIPIWMVVDRMTNKPVMRFAHEEDAVACQKKWQAKEDMLRKQKMRGIKKVEVFYGKDRRSS